MKSRNFRICFLKHSMTSSKNSDASVEDNPCLSFDFLELK